MLLGLMEPLGIVTVGRNTSNPKPCMGHEAGPGYDAVTGWSVPDSVKLLTALKAACEDATNDSVQFRQYAPADFERLYALEQACFQEPFRFDRRTMQTLVRRRNSAVWIAEVGERIAGFGIVAWTSRKGRIRAYIETLEVSAEARNGGIGRELLRRLEASATLGGALAIWLHVDAENASAIRLYEASGYNLCGVEEDFYPEGRAARVYAKVLAGDETAALTPAEIGTSELGGA